MTVGLELFKFSAYAVLIAHLLHEATHYLVSWAVGGEPMMAINGIRDSGWLQYVGTLEVHHYQRLSGDAMHAIAVAPFGVGLMVSLLWLKYGAGVAGMELWMVVGWLVYSIIGLPNDMRFEAADAESPT